MQRHIYNSCLGAYPPADEYAKPFYCLAFGLNMKSGQISVATAIADVFRKNGISVGYKFTKMLKIFDKIDEMKNRGVI